MESYIIIPAEIRADQNLKPLDKLLLGEILTLSQKHGYCWASNAYLAKTYAVSRRSIIRSLKILSDGGYVKIQYEYGNLDTHRTIIPTIGGCDSLAQGVTHSHRGCDSQAQGGVTNSHPNNTSANNTRINSERVSLEQAEKFFVSKKKSKHDAKDFFDHMESKNWSYKGEPIKNWEAFATAWIKNIKPEPKLKALQ